MEQIKPIETFYNGYRFRSRAEARWSVFFNCLKMRYYYEAEGFVCKNGLCYLPDFYLPECHAFCEVKGVMNDIDKEKIKMLMLSYPDYEYVVLYPDMTFAIAYVEYTDWDIEDADHQRLTVELLTGSDAVIARCRNCGKYYFMSAGGSWHCRCCGMYDGDNTFDCWSGGNILEEDNLKYPIGDITEIISAAVKGRQARFEHGEKP